MSSYFGKPSDKPKKWMEDQKLLIKYSLELKDWKKAEQDIKKTLKTAKESAELALDVAELFDNLVACYKGLNIPLMERWAEDQAAMIRTNHGKKGWWESTFLEKLTFCYEL